LREIIRTGDVNKGLKTMSDDDIDIQDFFGVTPLMYAVQLGQADFVKILVDKKADQSITDNVNDLNTF